MDINYVEKDVIDQQHLKKYRTAMHHVNCQSTWYSMSWLGQINPCVCSATQMQLWHYGKEWSCRSCKIWQLHTCIQIGKCYSKGPNMHMTPTNTPMKNMLKHCVSSTIFIAPPSWSISIVCRGTLQLRGHVGGHQGHQAAAQGVHLQRWHGSLIAPNLKCWQGIILV